MNNIKEIIMIVIELNSKYKLINSSDIEEINEEWFDISSSDDNLKNSIEQSKKIIDIDDTEKILNTLLNMRLSLQDFNTLSDDLLSVLEGLICAFNEKFFTEEKLKFEGDINKYLIDNYQAKYGSLIYYLHEENVFDQGLFDEMFDLIKSHFEQIDEKIILYKIFSRIQKFILCHNNQNDLYSIENISNEELNENINKFDDFIISMIK